jgi:hypothetical protein
VTAEIYLQTGIDPHLDVANVDIIRVILVDKAIQTGLMEKWLHVMIGG